MSEPEYIKQLQNITDGENLTFAPRKASFMLLPIEYPKHLQHIQAILIQNVCNPEKSFSDNKK